MNVNVGLFDVYAQENNTCKTWTNIKHFNLRETTVKIKKEILFVSLNVGFDFYFKKTVCGFTFRNIFIYRPLTI